jgi:hypothetical protein
MHLLKHDRGRHNNLARLSMAVELPQRWEGSGAMWGGGENHEPGHLRKSGLEAGGHRRVIDQMRNGTE